MKTATQTCFGLQLQQQKVVERDQTLADVALVQEVMSGKTADRVLPPCHRLY